MEINRPIDFYLRTSESILYKPRFNDYCSQPHQIQERLQLRIDALAENPRPSGVKKLEGAENQYRIRVGDYRIVYEIQDAILLIILVRIGHRSEVYRRR